MSRSAKRTHGIASQGSRSYANDINSRPSCGRLNFATHCFVEPSQLHLCTKIDADWVAAGALYRQPRQFM